MKKPSKSTLKPSEYNECVTLVDYLNTLKSLGKVILFTHVPNETYTTSWAQKMKNKKMGVARGFPDYVIMTTKGVMFIEMKAKTGGQTSPEQLKWIEALPNATVCCGYDEAKQTIDDFLTL